MASATHEDSPKKRPATKLRGRRGRAAHSVEAFLQANATAEVGPSSQTAAGALGVIAELPAAESLPDLESLVNAPQRIEDPDLESLSIPGSETEGACTPPRTGLRVWLQRGPQVPKGY